MVLLKNEGNALPIGKKASGTKVGLFGTAQIETIKGGTGSGDVNAAYTHTIAQGLGSVYTLDQDLLTQRGNAINPHGTVTRAEIAVLIYRIYHK